jgi:hypothetical protein
MVARADTPTHEHLRSRLAFLFVATIAVDAVASVLVLLFERHADGTEITNLGSDGSFAWNAIATRRADLRVNGTAAVGRTAWPATLLEALHGAGDELLGRPPSHTL